MRVLVRALKRKELRFLKHQVYLFKEKTKKLGQKRLCSSIFFIRSNIYIIALTKNYMYCGFASILRQCIFCELQCIFYLCPM